MNLLSKCAASTARLGASRSSVAIMLQKIFRPYGVVSTIPSSNMCQMSLRSDDTVISNKGCGFQRQANGFAIKHEDIFL